MGYVLCIFLWFWLFGSSKLSFMCTTLGTSVFMSDLLFLTYKFFWKWLHVVWRDWQAKWHCMELSLGRQHSHSGTGSGTRVFIFSVQVRLLEAALRVVNSSHWCWREQGRHCLVMVGHTLWEAQKRYSLVFPVPEIVVECFLRLG
jgi:hypothetical protein